jgi:hypothetical protein
MVLSRLISTTINDWNSTEHDGEDEIQKIKGIGCMDMAGAETMYRIYHCYVGVNKNEWISYDRS